MMIYLLRFELAYVLECYGLLLLLEELREDQLSHAVAGKGNP